MKKIILDTNAYTAFKANDSRVFELLKRVDYIGMSSVVLAELYSGFKLGNREKKNRQELELFLNSPRVDILTISQETADFYALIFSELRKKGTPIPTNDIWLAACALQHGLTLATFDQHFNNICGLLLVW